ncbi:hypothetical protein HaLaN_21059 [Haematococcus lacustris]|uniref:Uncharacterized protein n=1 Tax=Haematococcus lacustris TaxID=44745 RepID=A0A699ZXK5_HAELA|nr:hypothetical protein HaLaN_21059 [Haematococcus lacustris]
MHDRSPHWLSPPAHPTGKSTHQTDPPHRNSVVSSAVRPLRPCGEVWPTMSFCWSARAFWVAQYLRHPWQQQRLASKLTAKGGPATLSPPHPIQNPRKA